MSLYEEMLLRQHERERVERMALEAEREATRIREEEEVCLDNTSRTCVDIPYHFVKPYN